MQFGNVETGSYFKFGGDFYVKVIGAEAFNFNDKKLTSFTSTDDVQEYSKEEYYKSLTAKHLQDMVIMSLETLAYHHKDPIASQLHLELTAITLGYVIQKEMNYVGREMDRPSDQTSTEE